jgi:hypothetical protein
VHQIRISCSGDATKNRLKPQTVARCGTNAQHQARRRTHGGVVAAAFTRERVQLKSPEIAVNFSLRI